MKKWFNLVVVGMVAIFSSSFTSKHYYPPQELHRTPGSTEYTIYNNLDFDVSTIAIRQNGTNVNRLVFSDFPANDQASGVYWYDDPETSNLKITLNQYNPDPITVTVVQNGIVVATETIPPGGYGATLLFDCSNWYTTITMED